jgi:hypothetical protein
MKVGHYFHNRFVASNGANAWALQYLNAWQYSIGMHGTTAFECMGTTVFECMGNTVFDLGCRNAASRLKRNLAKQ